MLYRRPRGSSLALLHNSSSNDTLKWLMFLARLTGKKEDLSTSARRKTVDTSVTWLKKTVYLTNDPFDPVHQFKSEQQTQVGGWVGGVGVGAWVGV